MTAPIHFDNQRIAGAGSAKAGKANPPTDSAIRRHRHRQYRCLHTLAAVAIFFCDAAGAADTAGRQVCEREFSDAAVRHGVPLGFLYAVGLTETGTAGTLDPLAVNVAGAAHYPGSIVEAVAIINRARDSGVFLIDVGCMQINVHFHRHKFASLEDMFNPSHNVGYGAAYLKALKHATGNWTHAVARYHAGDGNRNSQRRYICRVVRNLIASGFGGWTQRAVQECKIKTK